MEHSWISGCADSKHARWMMHQGSLKEACLNTVPYFSRVTPTASNLADGPSRLYFDLCIRLGAVQILISDGDLRQCAFHLGCWWHLGYTPTYSKSGWQNGCFGLLSAWPMRVFDARSFFVLWRRVFRFLDLCLRFVWRTWYSWEHLNACWKPELKSAILKWIICKSFGLIGVKPFGVTQLFEFSQDNRTCLLRFRVYVALFGNCWKINNFLL